MDEKRVLILTASYGSGHNTAARFTAVALSKLYGSQINVKIVDLIELLPATVGKLTSFFYEFSMLYLPIAWDVLFVVTNHILYLFPGLKKFLPVVYNVDRVKKILQDVPSDIYVSTHPYWHNIVSKYKGRDKRYIVVVTDAIAIHPVWIAENVDFYIVFDEDTARLLITKYRVDEGKIRILGFPVDPLLGEEIDKERFLADIGLEVGRFTVLFNFGLGRLYNYLMLFFKLIHIKNHKLQFICITGKHKKLYNLLFSKRYSCPVKIVGWTDKMADYIRASDIIITKAGGGIIMESLAAKRPPVILSFPPGQEKGNVMLIKKYNVGIYEKNIERAIRVIQRFSTDEVFLNEKKGNMARVSRPKAAYDIARFIYENI